MEKYSKRFDFNQKNEMQLQEILSKKKKIAKLSGYTIPTQTDIVKEAIDLLYSHTFSDNYNDLVLEKLERMLGNRVERVITEMFNSLSLVIQNQDTNVDVVKELSILMIRLISNNAFDNQDLFTQKILENAPAEVMIRRALKEKE